eukprot:CAMPEP_0197883330 /NCGR_PEP_ID=MMETSP1439-20131203/10185_1 /TAXON_ID=66791 /ORGANISM="Gonyaulax spinifera, Strain CCMP409" /LENGTH=379 /DNA_ID=CAMNT_0043503047 /DNA_START=101 /DNA_END=1240 /DNA_ORIENTATION=+
MAMELDQVFVISEDPNEAYNVGQQKQESARASGDERGRALGLIKVADAAVQSGRTDEAQYFAQEALGICGEMRFEEGKAAAMNVMAKVLTKKGKDEEDFEEALDTAMDALKLFRKLSYRKGEAVALGTAAGAYSAMGRSPHAVKHAKEALAIFAELGDALSMAEMYVVAKDGYLAKSPPDAFRAEKMMQKALSVYQEGKNKRKEAAANHTLANVAAAGNDYKKASEYLGAARALYADASDFRGQASVMATLQALYLQAGMYTEAVGLGQRQVELFQDAGDVGGQAEAMIRLAEIMLDNEDNENAHKVATDALNTCMTIGDYDKMKMAKDVADDAAKAKKVEEIGMALHMAGEWTNIPTSLIVDPGLTRRVADGYASAMR